MEGLFQATAAFYFTWEKIFKFIEVTTLVKAERKCPNTDIPQAIPRSLVYMSTEREECIPYEYWI